MGLSQSVPAANEAVVAAVAGGALLLLLLRRRKPAADEPESRAEVAALYIHPVKSCAPVQLDAASLDRLGFVDDRRLMVVSAEPLGGNHSFVTQRQEPRLCLVRAELSAEVVRLSAPGKPLLAVPLRPPHPQSELRVRVWSDTGLRAVDLGEAAAAWLSSFLGAGAAAGPALPLRRAGAPIDPSPALPSARQAPTRSPTGGCGSSRAPPPPSPARSTRATRHSRCAGRGAGRRWASQTDSRCCSSAPPRSRRSTARSAPWPSRCRWDASGRTLSPRAACRLRRPSGRRCEGRRRPRGLRRARPVPQEDTWRRIRIGDMVFRVVKGCSRCKITTTDQATGEQGSLVGADGAPEPLSALRAAGRGVGSEVYFGQNLAHERPPPRHVAFDDHTVVFC